MSPEHTFWFFAKCTGWEFPESSSFGSFCLTTTPIYPSPLEFYYKQQRETRPNLTFCLKKSQLTIQAHHLQGLHSKHGDNLAKLSATLQQDGLPFSFQSHAHLSATSAGAPPTPLLLPALHPWPHMSPRQQPLLSSFLSEPSPQSPFTTILLPTIS